MATTIEWRVARLLYMPSYSPDFNSIEQIFAKLGGAQEQAIDILMGRIDSLFDRF